MANPDSAPVLTTRRPSTLRFGAPATASGLHHELSAAPDVESVCATIRARFRPYGRVARIELLPSQWLGRPAIVCIIDLETPDQTQAAQAGLGIARFGTQSLTVVVRDPLFSLAMTWAGDFRA